MPIFTLDLGPITLAPTWYGLMYALALYGGLMILIRRGRYDADTLESLLLWVLAGIVIGGRLGYVLFYDLSYFLQRPGEIFAIWQGGMSFHGGLLGVIAAAGIFCSKRAIPFLSLTDELALVTPLGLGLGRIGNYINGELVGYAPYSGPFAMMQGGRAHFPSPLLEMFLEGVLLGAILYLLSRKGYGRGVLSGAFLALYGAFRLIVELTVRLPDSQVGYLFGTQWLTMGALLSLAMIVAGGAILLKCQNLQKQKK